MILNKNKYVGRALDNRMGGFMIAEVARLLKESKTKLPFTLYVVNSVQEEIGLRGAQMIAERIKPDVALVTDVCHDTNTPMVSNGSSADASASASAQSETDSEADAFVQVPQQSSDNKNKQTKQKKNTKTIPPKTLKGTVSIIIAG